MAGQVRRSLLDVSLLLGFGSSIDVSAVDEFAEDGSDGAEDVMAEASVEEEGPAEEA